METIAETGINLFAEKLPDFDEIKQLAILVHSSESNRLKFKEKVEANLDKTSAKELLAAGVGLFILTKYSQAAEKLKKAKDCKEKFICMGLALSRTGKVDDAVESLQKSLDHGADKWSTSLEIAAAYRCASEFEAAEKELKTCAKSQNENAEYHCQLGRLRQQQGLYELAMDSYKAAMELSPDNQKALFHLAYLCDLHGDEEAAIDYYKQIISAGPIYVSALINLAVLYEDRDDYDKAAQCIDKVLKYHPNHPRALLFGKDIESSKTMFYDEEKEKKKSRKTQILETPISDFELSVRSRNCLRKMRIITIGDLLNISETEILSYKNFGETSLKEIKAILESKGLRLGMVLEDKVPSDGTEAGSDDNDEGVLTKPVSDLQLSVRAEKCLRKLSLGTLGDLTQKTEAELLGCKNFGMTSLNEIKKALSGFGLSFRNLD